MSKEALVLNLNEALAAVQAGKSPVDVILELLPGVDCTGCGCDTCRQAALAMTEGAPCNLCNCSNDEEIAVIAAVLGVEPLPANDKRAFVRCSGSNMARSGKRMSYPEGTECKDVARGGVYALMQDQVGDSADLSPAVDCAYGCCGGGTCVRACKFDALSLVGGVARVDPEKCRGCLTCTKVCPNDIVVPVPRSATNLVACSSCNDEETTRAVCTAGCVACEECVKACPEGCITIVDNHAVIDQEHCVGCTNCVSVCERKVILDSWHEMDAVRDRVACVHCTGGDNGAEQYKAAGYTDCRTAVEAGFVPEGACVGGCIGLGTCLSACRFDALQIVNGAAFVDRAKCTSCGSCVETCPKALIDLVPTWAKSYVRCSAPEKTAASVPVCSEGCIGCGLCEKNCPAGAIRVVNGHAVIDYAECVSCAACAYFCPRHIIRMTADPSGCEVV